MSSIPTIKVNVADSSVAFVMAWDLIVGSKADGSSIMGNAVLHNVDIKPLADNVYLDLGYVGGDLSVDNAWGLFAGVDYIGSEVEIADAAYSNFSFGYVGDSIEISDSAHVTLGVSGAVQDGVMIDDSEDISVFMGAASDYVYVSDTFDFSVYTGAGRDVVSVDGGSGRVLGGSDDDSFYFQGGQIAYNPESGNDFVFVSGGRTLGNTFDGEADIVVFDLFGGGNHALVADSYDEIFVSAGSAGLWSFEDAQTIGLTDTSWMQASLLVQDWYGGGKG